MGEQDKTETTASNNGDLNQLKETFIAVATAIDKMHEPKNDLNVLSLALGAAVSSDRCSTDAAFATFLYEDLGPGLVKRLHKERSNDETYLKVVADVLELLVRLFALELKKNRFSYSFYSAMTLLFNHEAVIHKYHYQIPDNELQKLRTFGQEWRKNLVVGDMVDVYVKADERGKLSGWMQAQIASVDGDSLHLIFPLSSNIYDGKMDRWSTELVEFESKTKQDYEWRKNVLLTTNMLECDVHDKSSWNKSTIFEIKKQTIEPNRVIDLAYCALRVYRDIPNSLRKDERGSYEGWSVKFDEWIPVFSPRIMPWGTKVGVIEEDDLTDDLDDLIECDAEFSQIFAVPRLQVCISALYLRYINIFGNEGGFDVIINLLKNPHVEKENEGININIMGCLAQILTLPYPVFHKNFIKEKGQLISDTIKNRLLITTDQALRDVRKEQVDAIIKSVESISRRFLNKEDREKQSEILRLELCNKSLKSSYLERRIQGIRDLNLLIKNNTQFQNSKTFTTEFLIDWMVQNDVFVSIWDTRKTHIQIVQRTNEIFKLLLKENKLDETLLKLFWSLTKSEYQTEVLKIVSECSYYLKQTQIEFFFNEVTSQPAEKLSLPEFDLLCDLGKQCKNSEFQERVGAFFWHIILNADNYKEDLVENATRKYAEMVKFWPLTQKQVLFNQLVGQIKLSSRSVLPTLRLFTKLIKDQKERTTTTYNTSYSTAQTVSEPIAQYSHVTASGSIITSYSYQPVSQTEESIYNAADTAEVSQTQSTSVVNETLNNKNEQELTLREVLNKLQNELGLVDALLDNLNTYCKLVKTSIQSDQQSDRQKLFILSKNNSHADEIEERLQFLKFYASVSDYQFRKQQLRVIYDSLAVQSPIKQDQNEFLHWCRQACQDSTSNVVILDLNEVGEYFSELLINKSLDVETLPIAGFEFLQNYFISVNENVENLVRKPKQKPVQIQQTAGISWSSYYVSNKPQVEEVEDDEPDFDVCILPSQLQKLDLIWTVVMEARNEIVVKKSIDFLIKIYMQNSTQNRSITTQQLIVHCIELLRVPKLQTIEISRIIKILRQVIQESEKNGTGDVQPHKAILKGEILDRIIINNMTKYHSPNLVVKVFTSATVWEFVDKVSRMCDLAPKYVEFKLSNGNIIKDLDYGKTLGELGIKNHDIITVNKNNYKDETGISHLIDSSTGKPKDIAKNNLIDPDTQKLTQQAFDLFNEWFDKYSSDEGVMTPESTTRFILGATNEVVNAEDNRIKGLFQSYDENKDNKLERHEFLKFYEDASKEKAERVFDNILNHFVRVDLKKISDVYENELFEKHQMPRHTLSHNQEQFDTLISLLDRQDGTSSEVWELISMLETNQKMYQQVLSLQIADNNLNVQDQNVFWQLFFESGSIYKQSYAHEIIEALMEDGEDLTNRVFFVEFQDNNSAQNKTMLPVVKSKEVNQENKSLKENWTNKFLENGGLSYVLNVFLAKAQKGLGTDKFQVQELKFMLTILKVFISAAMIAYSHNQEQRQNNNEVGQEESKNSKKADNATVTKLIEIMKGPNGTSILDGINFEELQARLLQLIAQIVQNQTYSSEEKNIVQNALNLWMHIVFFKPQIFAEFLATDKIDELIMSGLLYCSEENIRSNFQTVLLKVAKNLYSDGQTQTALGYLIKLLSKNFYKISQYRCRQFFELFNQLIDLHFIKVSLGSEEKDLFNPEDLLGQIIDKIRADNAQNHEQVETQLDEITAKEQAAEKERLMIGLVLLTQKIIGKVDTVLSEKIVREKDLINEIFKEFLFSSVFKSQTQVQGDSENMLDLIKKKAPRKVQITTMSGKAVNKPREVAYQLLNELISKSPVIMNNFIRDQLKPLLEMIKKPKTWNYTPPNSSERVQKYVGLRNLGCICYMNSMMQQFFMIPAFRYNLLCVDDGLPEQITEYRQEQIDDNMMHQMQKLFAHLELSERSDYNPIGFTFSFKEFDGGPTNISEQKDAQEFLNVLFDRVENALKPTSRKYLLQSVFGGKTCSQLICPECGKVKNRIEDYYNMSLTVKDINSVYDSLGKQVEGEIISDFQCDGCNKKVDITKRVLIAETPNVLIVHLQRILFNFDTFRNDKLNQHFEFPTHLDLKPYSYYGVMERENRVTKEEKKDGEDISDRDESIAPEKEEKKADAENQDNQVPIEDDCFEYKLVGVNVHSGSANAGHYWSYINTVRGMDEKDASDPTWAETEKDQWMEFNDSQVKDYKFENLKDECYGDKPNSQTTASAWNFGGSYGKSGYMLFYERRIKKPIKIVVPQDQTIGKQDIHYDEKTKEYIKHIAYREGIDKETPNKIFTKVLEDNTKFTFENDIYSQEFFDFIKKILHNVASFGGVNDSINKEMRSQGIQIAQKAAFDILARCMYNSGIKDLVNVMIQIFQQDSNLVIEFCQSILDTNNGEPMLEILLDCSDSTARSTIGDLFCYLLSKLKMLEKELLKSDDHEKTVSARFVNLITSHLNLRAAKSWSKFDRYLQLFLAFGLQSPEEILEGISGTSKNDKYNVQSEAAQIGLEYYFKTGKLEKFLDFILADKSPLFVSGQSRIQMGGSYSQPNFTPIMKVISEMIGKKNLIEKFPLSEVEQQMVSTGTILGKIVEDNAQNKDFGEMLTAMCQNNFKMTRKLSKIFIKAFNQNVAEKFAVYLKALKKFLLIQDSLQTHRLEWIFGVPQIKTTNAYRSTNYQFGVECIERINDTAYHYFSTLSQAFSPTSENSLLERLLCQRGRQDDFCIKAVKDLMSLCIKDVKIAKYIYTMPPYSYQYSRYSDWFRPYIEKQRQAYENNNYAYYQAKIKMIQKAHDILIKFEEVCSKFQTEDQKLIDEIKSTENYANGIGKSWMIENEEVIKHYPPQYIIGQQDSEVKTVLLEFEDEFCKVQLIELDNEYIYSNPTRLFNLSLPEKLMRTENFTFVSYSSYKDLFFKKLNPGSSAIPQIETRDWLYYHTHGPVLLQLFVTSKVNGSLRLDISVTIEGENPNVSLPKSSLKETIFGHDKKAIAHFMKLEPDKEWGGNFKLQITTQGQAHQPKFASPQDSAYYPPTQVSYSVQTGSDEGNRFECYHCQATAFTGMEYCDTCGQSLKQEGYHNDYP